MDVDTTFARQHTRRLQEQLFAIDEVEAILGELPPELVEQRERTQRQLAAFDRALIAAANTESTSA